MPDLALDPATGDLEIRAGKLRIVRGAELFRQRWASRVTLFKGEWFLDRNKGTDYQNHVLGKNRRRSVLRALFIRLTKADPECQAVTKMSVELGGDRVLRVKGEALVGGATVSLTLNETIGDA